MIGAEGSLGWLGHPSVPEMCSMGGSVVVLKEINICLILFTGLIKRIERRTVECFIL